MLYQNNKTTISQLSWLIFLQTVLSDILVNSLLALIEHPLEHTYTESPFPHNTTLIYASTTKDSSLWWT